MLRTVGRKGASAAAAYDFGSVTAEAAIALPALVVVFGAGVWGLGIGSLQARCESAARSAALAAARGEEDSAITTRVSAALGPGAVVALSHSGATVSVLVAARSAGAGLLPSWSVSATATAELEPPASLP